MKAFTRRVSHDFSEAAPHYDQHAQLQRQVTEELASYVIPTLAPYHRWLDAGCGTGYFQRWLQHTCAPLSQLIQLDIAEGMCRVAATSSAPTFCADIQHLPFASGSFDGIFSSLALQWSPSAEASLLELRRVLRPGGILAFSTLLPGTLQELEEALRATEQASRLHPFLGAEQWEAALLANGWRMDHTDTRNVLLTFRGPRAVLAHLQGLGATRKSSIQPMSPGQLHRALHHYPRTAEGQAQATFRVMKILARAT
jgi:malonyl-CoA O-methyltransferase